MPKSITRQIQDLQSQNKKLRELDRLFEKAIKMEFGLSRAEIHTLINASKEPQQDKLGQAMPGIAERGATPFADLQAKPVDLQQGSRIQSDQHRGLYPAQERSS